MKRLGKYEIVSEIGRGGFGVVYKALDPSMNRLVAVKVLESVDQRDMLVRFRNEAAAGGNLRHRNITTIYDFGEEHGTPYIVMEFLDGQDLEQIISSGHAVPRLQRLEILIQAAEGLHCAHQSGIIHRDVKPANIMVLNDGTVKLMDFGIARLTQSNLSAHTRTGMLVGTVRYMAPEQFEGLNADQRADIWAWGVIGWELFSGEHPFDAADPATVMYRITTSNLSEADVNWPDCPAGLTAVLKRAVSRQRNQRFPSFEDVLFDLKPVQRELQRMRASQFIADARGKLQTGQIQEAQQLLRRVLDLDADHPELAEVRTRLQAEVGKRQTSEEASELMAGADRALAARRFEEAINCLEAAQRLAPERSGILSKLEIARAGQQRLLLSQSLLAEAQRELSSQNFSRAFNYASEASQADPANEEAGHMLTTVQAAMRRRQISGEIASGLERAGHLLALQEFAEAIALIESLAAQHEMWPAMQELLDRAKAEQSTLETRLGIERILDSARSSMEAGQPGKALQLLEELCRRYPGAYPQAEQLLVTARQQVNAASRLVEVNKILREAADLHQQGKYEPAKGALKRGLVQWPDDADLTRALEKVTSAKAEHDRAGLIQKAREKGEQLRKRGRFNEALEYLDRVMPQLGESADLVALRQAIESEKSEREAFAAKHRSQGRPASAPAGQPEPAPGVTPETATRMLSGVQLSSEGAESNAAPVSHSPALGATWTVQDREEASSVSQMVRSGKFWAALAGAAVLGVAAWLAFRLPGTAEPPAVARLVAPGSPLRFHFRAAADAVQTQALVLEAQGGHVDVSIEGETPGVEPRPRSGKAPGEFLVEARKDSFSPGMHKAWLRVRGGGQELRYPVEVLVDPPAANGRQQGNPNLQPARLLLSPPDVRWKGSPGGQLAQSDIKLSSSAGPVPYEVAIPAEDADWLSATPRSGSAPATIRFSLRRWPAPGRHSAVVRVAARSPGGGSSTVNIELEVAAPAQTQANTQQTASPGPSANPKGPASPSGPETVQPASNPAAAQASQIPALYGGRTSGRLTWTGSLPPGGAIVVNRDGLVSGPGSAAGAGPPSVVPTQIVDLTPVEAKYSVSPFENNPAGKVEIRNTGVSPITFIQLRWRVRSANP